MNGGKQDTTVYLYTDGACKGNPGKGGWGALICYKNIEKPIYGGENHTTNNRMEMMAVIQGLEALIRPCNVHITTDSKYVMDNFPKAEGWRQNDWRNGKRGVKNPDLWGRMLDAASKHKITWTWVRGHNGHRENEIADELANLGVTVR